MSDMKVKGNLIIDFVKVIRANKDLGWDQYLTPGDLELVNTMIIPAGWYPIEHYQRMGIALHQLIAKENEEVLRQFARALMQGLFAGAYRPFLDKHDPFAAAQRFLDLRVSLFNFARGKLEKTGEKSLRINFFIGNLGDVGLDIFLRFAGYYFQLLIELNGGQNVKMDCRREIRENEKVLVYELAWD